MISVANKNGKQKLALAIPTGPPITIANDAIEIPPFIPEKTINDLSK